MQTHSRSARARRAPARVARRWNQLKADSGTVRPVGPLPPGTAVNLADALVGPDVLRSFLANREVVVRYFIRSVEADAAADGTAETAALLDRLLAYEGVDAVVKRTPDAPPGGPVLPLRFRKGEAALDLFTTIAALGTPQDITLQELRIECFFPLDEPTADLLRTWPSLPAEGREISIASRDFSEYRRRGDVGLTELGGPLSPSDALQAR